MRNLFPGLVAASLLFAGSPTHGLNTDIPPTGLPTASMFSATLLPETEGVVSWKTLSQVEPHKQGDRIVPVFSKEILGLDKQAVRVQGFILPLDLGDQQHHFLLSAVPPHCPFCLPAGPEAIVEVVAKKRIAYSFEPIILAGNFSVLKDTPEGLLYRLTEAEPVATPRK
jgi:hypothetical protein